jgi:3-hydroxybutyryl-CoA dehydrogenase
VAHMGIGIVGAGVMGSEIAFVAAVAGTNVVLCDTDPEALTRGVEHVVSLAGRAARKGRISHDDAATIVARVHPSTDIGDLHECDLVIEAVSEVMATKRVVFGAIDRAVKPDALIASNTSGLSISELAAATTRPTQVVGLHFFNPASVMRLVEIVSGNDTSEETLARAEQAARDLGKTPVRVRECAGFLVNRVLIRAMVEAYRRADELCADPAAVDAAVVASGPAPMGPFALGDLIGLDTMEHVRGDLEAAYGARFLDAGVLATKVDAGLLGRKSGRGFFGDAAPEAPTVDAAAHESAEGYYTGAIDEAVRCRDERIADADDIDIALCLGAGWSEGPLTIAHRDPATDH